MLHNVNSVVQFKIMEFIEANFCVDEFEFDLSQKERIKITDKNGDSLLFSYKDGKITWE